MKIKKNIKIFLWLALFIIMVIFLLIPKSILSGEFNLDKIAHFASFFLLSYFSFKTFPGKAKRLKILFIIFTIAVVSEYLQIYIPHREFSYEDMSMNIMGMIAGIFLFKLIK
jgi:VanZ family protein